MARVALSQMDGARWSSSLESLIPLATRPSVQEEPGCIFGDQ